MPVMTKEKHRRLMNELQGRYGVLLDALETRELNRPGEGTNRAHSSWLHPDEMCATKKGSLELRLAVTDFSAILTELKSLK